MVKITEQIASLSTGNGPYYERPEDWYGRLILIIEKLGYHASPMPTIHTNEGNDLIECIHYCCNAHDTYPPFDIYFTWYQMPSGRWEIVCYVT